jgi:hypothetical protein
MIDPTTFQLLALAVVLIGIGQMILWWQFVAHLRAHRRARELPPLGPLPADWKRYETVTKLPRRFQPIAEDDILMDPLDTPGPEA